MEVVKEYLLAKYFSPFGYIVAVFHLLALTALTTAAGVLRTSERRRFSCPSSPDSKDDCLRQYDKLVYSGLPFYGFVLFCFASVLTVCIAYSWCFVKSRVDEIEIALKPNPESPRRRPRVKTRRVFWSYFVHLILRFFGGIVFIILQNSVFYLSGFPAEFVCFTQTVKGAPNSTNVSTTKENSLAINCDNSIASDNAVYARGIWIVNILFTLLVFGELCYLSLRAIQRKQFIFDSEFCERHFFSKGRNPIALRELTFRTRQRIREETEILEPLIAQPEIDRVRLLDDAFVDLVIYSGRACSEFADLLKRHEIFDIYLKPQYGSIAIKKVDELFLPNEDTRDPRKILVVGRPGIGKSLLCTKLSRDWSKSDLLRDSDKIFQHLFVFQFRWFNTETMEKISLKQLLSRLCSEGSMDSEVLQHILDNPERVLIVFDGLDEFKYHERILEDERAHAGNSATEEMPFSALYVKLMKGKQLSGATILTTCRPNVVQSVAHLPFDRKVEIMGFTPEKVHEYVLKFCAHDPETVNRIWGHISSNLELLSLCYIPVNSFIICSLLEKLIKLQQHLGNTLPATSTDIYEGALRLFIFKHHPEFKRKLLTKDYLLGNVGLPDQVEETLNRVGSLAKTGIQERRLMFDSVEVKGIEDCGLFNRMPDCEVLPFKLKSQFCFIHLTLQEFLAAKEIVKMDSKDISNFILTNASDPKWHLVLQFVAGLLRGQTNEAVSSFVSLLCDSLTYITLCDSLTFSSKSKQEAVLMMKCLHEYNDATIVEKAASLLQKNETFNNKIDLSYSKITPVDCAAIVFFINKLHNLMELNLSSNNISDQGVSFLCSVVRDGHCTLNTLHLGFNKIQDQGVSQLSEALRDANCKLTKLKLPGNYIRYQGASHLQDALKNANCKLTKLDLGDNSMGDIGVSRLSEALKDVNCKLEKLNLNETDITDQGVFHLCEALKNVNCKLTKLDISVNMISFHGALSMSVALKDVNCKLTKMNLDVNDIGNLGVFHLSDALKDENCKFTRLDLTGVKMGDEGLAHLCDALINENCLVTDLDLSYNAITGQGVSYLQTVLRNKNCKLLQLNLAMNMLRNPSDFGKLIGLLIKGDSLNFYGEQSVLLPMSSALRDENCKLVKLDLISTGVEDGDLFYLCGALKDMNCKLTVLYLGGSLITDEGLQHLCSALEDVNCKLTELLLRSDSITDQDVPLFFTAIKHKNCKLTKLEIQFPEVTDEGFLHLLVALKDVNCKLIKLKIQFPEVTDEGFLHLLVALKDVNCKLTKLSLKRNELMDQFIPHLCSALEDPNCKLIKLDLTSNKFTEQGKNMLHQALKSENRTIHIKVEV
ncbi:NACHT, LRR and PYD domains-containing protein 12 [Pocillopora verrucosa]|uniref:NACHT, LRR and PYD domains-containing protein 12 n=1 Tax=Pocillopora verrucosa TaxID=203993 RepID=UPI00334178FD